MTIEALKEENAKFGQPTIKSRNIVKLKAFIKKTFIFLKNLFWKKAL